MATYDIELTGQLHSEGDLDEAKLKLGKLFKLSAAQVDAMLAKAPLLVKRNADEPTAKKFKAALQQANWQVRVRMNAAAPLAAASAAIAKKPLRMVGKTLIDNPDGLSFALEGQPDYAFLTVHLPESASLKVEAASMACMDTHIKMRTRAKGGLGRLFTGESLFINEFSAEDAPGEVGIAPGIPGDILHRHLHQGDALYLQNSAFLAASPELTIETKLDIFKGIFSGAGLVLIKCVGPGDLWFNTYGAAVEVDVDGEYVVDTDKIVAWEDGLQYKVTSVGGYKSLFFSGEGFVCRFSGKGKLWVQTRSASALKSWAHWFRPVGKG